MLDSRTAAILAELDKVRREWGKVYGKRPRRNSPEDYVCFDIATCRVDGKPVTMPNRMKNHGNR